MIDSLYIGATGMHAQQTQIDVIANNLANVNTVGFKRGRVEFADLLYRNQAASATAGGQTLASLPTGMGTSVAATGKIFSVGDLKNTGQPLDVAIKGNGFFELTLADGSFAYTRAGSFQVNSDGTLVSQNGVPLAASIQLPPNAANVKIDVDGHVTANVPNETKPVDVGRIELTTFLNPAGLNPIGDNLFAATTASGDPTRSNPGENNTGTLAQGFTEASNVQLVEEMINLVIAQRAYEVNSKVVQASDEMLSISNGLLR